MLHAMLLPLAAVTMACITPVIVARVGGRIGPPLLQPIHDWQRLLRKRPVVSESASVLFEASPAIQLVITCVAALLVPSFTRGMTTASVADLLVIVGLLLLSQTLTALAAVDTATGQGSFPALGVARTLTWAQPVMLIAALTLALLTGTTNLDAAAGQLREAGEPGVPLFMVAVAIAAVLVVIDADLPEDLAEYSGWRAVAAQLTRALRRVVWLSVLALLVMPFGLADADAGIGVWLVGLLVWPAKLVLLATVCTAASFAVKRAGARAVVPVLGSALMLSLLSAVLLFAGEALV